MNQMGAIKDTYHDIIVAGQAGRVLTLVVKAEWFDMYIENFKKEDYRAISPYWERRLLKFYKGSYDKPDYKEFDFVDIRKGYSKIRAIFKFEGIEMKTPNKFWSPPEFHDIIHFAIKVGEMVYTENVYSDIDRALAERSIDENVY